MVKRVEYFIAQRTAHAPKGDGQGQSSTPNGGMMMRVASIAIALSMAVMILTLAIILGFKSEVHTRLTALSGDIIIASTRGVNPASNYSIQRSAEVERIATQAAKEFSLSLRHITPFATRAAILRAEEGVEGVILKGVDSTFRRESFERGLIEGEIPSFGGSSANRNTIISKELASQLGLKVGSRLTLLVTSPEGSMRRDLYRVGAIYSAGTGEGEKAIIITDIRNVQRLNGWGEELISGYEVGLAGRSHQTEVSDMINREVIFSTSDDVEGVAAFPTERLYPAIFDWLAALDVNAVVVISIMMIVAIFNIITALLILVIERVQMVGILKTLGMNNLSIRKIFLHRAFNLTLRGLAYGNGVGIGLGLIQHHFRIIKLDQAGYLLDSVPIDLGVGWLLALNVGVVVTILAVVIFPTRIVSSVEPSEAVKFQ